MARITVVCAGHLWTCPRMVKAADALVEAGHDVRVVSTMPTRAGAAVDRRMHARRRWRWAPVAAAREDAAMRWLLSGARAKAARRAADWFGARAPRAVVVRAYGRLHPELVRAILAEETDVVYAGTNGAITAALDAAAAAGVPCGVDFEDFHCAETSPENGGALTNALADAVMKEATARAAFITAGSSAIADACAARFGRRPVPISNVFSLPSEPSFRREPGPLRLYWFSQTIGAGRGLEQVVEAAGRAATPMELHLRGTSRTGFVDTLRSTASALAPDLRVLVHAPAEPDAMVASCAAYDVGLGAEPGSSLNNVLLLSNKALTYPLAGLAVVLSHTPGQQPLLHSLNGESLSCEPGDTAALADGLRRWALDAGSLRRARQASWDAARSRWHWEHPLERDAMIAAVAGCL